MKNNKYEETHGICEEIIKGCSAECRIAQFPHEKAESCSRCGGWRCPYKEMQVTCIPCTSDGYIHSPRLKGLIKKGMGLHVVDFGEGIVTATTEHSFTVRYYPQYHIDHPELGYKDSFTGGRSMLGDHWIKILPQAKTAPKAKPPDIAYYNHICDAPREMFQVGKRVRTNGDCTRKTSDGGWKFDSVAGTIHHIDDSWFEIRPDTPKPNFDWTVYFKNEEAWIEFLPKEDKMGMFTKVNKIEEVWKNKESQEHFEASNNKWGEKENGALYHINCLIKVVKGACGHCAEFRNPSNCNKCALAAVGFCEDDHKRPSTLFGRISAGLTNLKNNIKEMHQAVIDSKPAFMKKEEVFYKVGDKFDSGLCINRLCHIGDGVLLMIDTASSQFNSKQISYGGDVDHIPESKFQKMFGSGYTLIKD